MIKVYQKTYNDCTAACFASIFELKLEDVPNFCGQSVNLVRAWVGSKGYYITDYFLASKNIPPQTNIPYLATLANLSPKDWLLETMRTGNYPEGHAVVGLNGKIIHDPLKGRSGYKKEVFRWYITPLDSLSCNDPS